MRWKSCRRIILASLVLLVLMSSSAGSAVGAFYRILTDGRPGAGTNGGFPVGASR